MLPRDPYQLLDFGQGRKLERFGRWVLDRPAPAAEGLERRDPARWAGADARYDRQAGRGRWSPAIEESWPLRFAELALELKLTEFGQVGVFPEQADNWTWLAEQVRAHGRPVRVLNLFAYTGAATLSAAAAGAEVTHVDAAPGVVAWARRNALLSDLSEAPIRWIVDDALKFVGRELKRGRRYDGLVLDPPAYGHGPHGEVWKLETDFGKLLSSCLELAGGRPAFMLLTCHSGEWAHPSDFMREVLAKKPELRDEGTISGLDMALASVAGGWLHAGAAIRFSAHRGRQRQPRD